MRKIFFFSIVFICLLVPLLVTNINPDQAVNPGLSPNSSANTIHSAAYSTITPALDVIEYANRTDVGQAVTLRYNATSLLTTKGSASAILPPNWQGNQILINLYDIFENRCWNLNPAFNGPQISGISKNISEVFKYGNGQIAAVRTEGRDKTFYMAFIFQRISNTTVRNVILSRTLSWMGLLPGADILIIDDDSGGTYHTAYENSLTSLGYSYQTIQSPSWNQIRNRRLVIWCAGPTFDIMDPLSPSSFPGDLITYLDQAGSQNLITSGQDVGYSLDDKNTYNTPTATGNNFFNNYLNANFIADDAESNSTLGISGDIIGNQLSFFINASTVNPDYIPDAIMPNYRNNESKLYNWTGMQLGNNHNDDWYYHREKNGHALNDDSVLLLLEDETNAIYDTGDRVWIEQDLLINRSNIVWAGINFDYWAYNTFAPYTGSFKIFVSINNTEVYSKSFSDVVAFQKWYNTGMVPINVSAITLPKIKVKVGLQVTYGINYNPDIKPMVKIDNFKLYLKTKVSPAQINLKMDGLTVNGGIGYGICELIPASPWINSPVRVNFSWAPSPVPNPNFDITVTFECNTNLFASKTGETLYAADPSKTGLLLETDHGLNTFWSFQYYVNVPTGYWNHSFTIFHPPDWAFTFASEPQKPLINKLSKCINGSNYITIPATNLTVFPDGYWRFEAHSPNYLRVIQPQIYNGGSWINSTNFLVTNLTRIICHIFNGTGSPPNLDSSLINLTIIDPAGLFWYNATTKTFQNGWAIFSNFTIFGSNTTGGLYKIMISWDNGLEAGYIESNFSVIHKTSLVLSKPSDAVLDYSTEINYGELLLIRIGLNDTNRNELVEGVDITLNWTQAGSPVQKSLIDLETGQYDLVLDTTDLPSAANYTLLINSSSPYYSASLYTLKLIVTTETMLSSPQYPKIIEEWGKNITIQVDYLRALDEMGINNSIITVNWTLGPSSINEIGNGRYNIKINLSYAEIREYTLVINASKPNCAFKTLKIKVEVLTIDAELLSDEYPRVSGEWNTNITITVNYRTLSSSGIPDALIKVNWTQNYYSIIEPVNGYYQIELNTSCCNLREYILLINASRTHYSTKTLQIRINIKAIETELLSDDYPHVSGEWNTNITITVNYRTYSSFDIPNALIKVNWTQNYYSITEPVNGYYQIELNTSWCNVREYLLVINASKDYHSDRTLRIRVNIKVIETELLSDDYPRVVGEWNKNITLEINYRTTLELKGITNALIIINWSLSYYQISETSNGIYQIELNTSACSLKDYTLTINAFQYRHWNKSILIIIQIRAVDTKLTYKSIDTIPYGKNGTIYLKYTDFAGNPIASQANGADIFSINTTFWISYNPLAEYPFTIIISTASLQETDLLNITASKYNHKSQSVFIFLSYRPIFTSLSNLNTSLIILPVKESTFILVVYNDTEQHIGIENAGITFYGYSGLSFTGLANGYYKISITAGITSESYTILATINRTGYLEKSIQFIIQIKEWTEFTATTVSSNVETTQQGSMASFSLLLENEFTNSYFNEEDIIVFYVWGSETGNLTYNGNGNYSLVLNTANKNPGTYSIVINATTKDGDFLVSKTLTLVITRIPPSWFERNSWLFGIAGAIIAVVAGYSIRNRWRERNWERKVRHIYILTKTGIPLYDKRLGGVSATDASLVSSALIGISSIVQEIVHSKRVLKTIDHMDNKILFQHGFYVIVAVLASVDLPIIRKKIASLSNKFEFHYQKELADWKGDVDAFFGANKIINEFFPIEEYIKDKEISAEWIIERLFELYGLSGIVTLLMVELGLKEPSKIAAGAGIKEKMVPIILRTLQDLVLIDSRTTLTQKGKEALAIYKERKEKYLNILRLAKRESAKNTKEEESPPKPRI